MLSMWCCLELQTTLVSSLYLFVKRSIWVALVSNVKREKKLKRMEKTRKIKRMKVGDEDKMCAEYRFSTVTGPGKRKVVFLLFITLLCLLTFLYLFGDWTSHKQKENSPTPITTRISLCWVSPLLFAQPLSSDTIYFADLPIRLLIWELHQTISDWKPPIFYLSGWGSVSHQRWRNNFSMPCISSVQMEAVHDPNRQGQPKENDREALKSKRWWLGAGKKLYLATQSPINPVIV